ncbi:aminotransferase class I/II-fold pyridoxal phosphate-dependent enzyme [Thermovenabulum gondwanense]|uniref:Methionine gamma-lyase n=1 Tax=Thermovenabulum gondwanense TaxID=520767 RepID=A0A161PT23_9FIRM|nr:methionine gamma-lyase family protein [Thermovenabulum gondwanense]KYO64475.1 Methionine gamma-lyase [Thermovenabulum gondwanense]
MHNESIEFIKEQFNINEKVIKISQEVIEELKESFLEIDKIEEYNQYKVINAMVKNELSDYCLGESTGYGYNDVGREMVEKIYKSIFRSEDALVRPQIISGTHALTICLFGILRPGDELISVTGEPYDTLKDVIEGENNGSLKDFNIKFKKIDLINGEIDFESIKKNINKNTKMVLIQRSRGYSLRPSLSVLEIGEIIKFIKNINEKIICLVDNCYGEFVEEFEPTEVGADLCAGSLIKNPGGGISPTGGYITGKKNLVELCSYKLFAPGIGKNCGPSILPNRLIIQGLFYAPKVVSEAKKGALFISCLFEKLGFEVFPKKEEKRSDIVTAILLKNKETLIEFCKGLQKVGPVDSHVTPEPWDMPGYNHQVIMAGGSFVQGASIELSADAPIREPYVVYVQGGTSLYHIKLGILCALQNLYEKNLIEFP